MVKKLFKKAKSKIATDNERGARQNLIEDLFYDFNRSRKQVYTMNFIRGIFFGLGSILGGTVVIALIVWLLSVTVNVFPPLADFINGIIDAMQRPR
jgi:hypothetical protein